MKGIGNTKAQLTDEVRSLRQKIAELEARVTVGKQAEAKLKESEEGYRKLIETSPYCIFVHVDQKIIFMNPAGLELLGAHNSSEIIGKSILDFPHPDYLEVIKRRQELLKKGEAPRNEYIKAIRLDGRVIDIETTSARVTYQGKSAVMATLRDVTDRLKAEGKLKESEENYRKLIETSPDCIFVHIDQKIVFMNPAGLELLGAHNSSEIIGKSILDFPHPDYLEVIKRRQELLKKGEAPRNEYVKLLRLDGSVNDVEVTAARVTYQGESAVMATARDVSDRLKAEELIEKSRTQYRDIVNNSVLGMAVYVPGQPLVFTNKRMTEITGYSVEEIESPDFNFMVLFTEEDQRLITANIKRRFTGEYIPPYESMLISKTGDRKWVLIYNINTEYEGESAIQVQLLDISERKQAEEELRKHREHLEELVKERTAELQQKITEHERAEEELWKSEEKYRTLVEGLEDVIVRFALDGTILYCSPNVNNFGGYDSKEEIGQHFTKYIADEEAKQELQEFFQGIIKRKKTVTFEFRYMPKSKDPFYVEAKANPIINEKTDEIVSIQCIVRDITERKKAEEEIKAEKEFTDNVIDSLPDTFYIFDPESGKGIQWNKALNEISGYNYEEMSELPPLHFYPPEEHQLLEEAVETTLEKGRATVELNYIIADGTRIPFEYSTVLIKDAEGKPCICAIGRDITKRKEMEEKLVRSEKLAVLGQLAGGVSHELRNPLGAIKNAAYFLNMVLEEPEPEVKETLDILEKEVATSERIISSLLGFARPKPPIRRKVAINEVIQEALYHVTVPKNVKVVTQPDKSLPAILADPDQLGQVFTNVTVNGFQAMPEGGQLAIKSEVPSPGWVAISFADTGVGITKQNLKKLFEPLFSTKAKGIGLGLAVTKTLVEGHGGTVKAQSKVGKGSTFTVRLPIDGEKEK